MNENDRQSDWSKSARGPRLAGLAIAGVFFAVLLGVSIWMAGQLSGPATANQGLPGKTAAAGHYTVSGDVTDATTHQPVGNFTARLGYNLNNGLGKQPPFYNQPSMVFSGGHYQLPDQMNPPFKVNWTVRIEARGYKVAALKVREGAKSVDFALTPAPDLQGRVLGVDGARVSGATVLVALRGVTTTIVNGKAQSPLVTRVLTDSDGKYEVPAQSGDFTLAAFCDAGFGQVDQNEVIKSSDILLQAWGRMKGRFMIGTKPGANLPLEAVSTSLENKLGTARISFSNTATTDKDGNYEFDDLIPGRFAVSRLIRRGATTQPVELGMVQVAGGGATTADFGGVGRPVTGRLILPHVSGASGSIIEAYALRQPDAGVAARLTQPARRRYMLELDEQNRFRIDDVPPGEYVISVNVRMVRGGARMPRPGQARFTMPDVPGGVSDEPLVLPDITMNVP
jgi:hypothetical protein